VENPLAQCIHCFCVYMTPLWWLGGVVVMISDLQLVVVGSNPGHDIAGFF